MKRFLAILLSLLMMLAMSATAFAADETPVEKGTITLTSAIANQTYSIYKLFDLTYHSGAHDSYSYTYAKETAEGQNPWNDFFFGENAEGSKYVTITGDGYASWNTVSGQTDAEADAYSQEFAQAALAYAKETAEGSTEPRVAATVSLPAVAPSDGSTNITLTFENLDLGYYLIDSTQGALCFLTSASPKATIWEKNGQPDVTKVIVNEDGTTTDWNNASIGDTINYQSSVIVRNGAQNYMLHDVMDEGLTLNQDSFYIEYYEKTETGYSDTAIAFDTNKYGKTTTAQSFEILFDNTYIASLAAETMIVVNYTATLNEKAAIQSANINETWITYGDNNESNHDITATYTWDFQVIKVNDSGDPLADAVFTLSKEENGAPITFTKKGETAAQDAGVPAAEDVSYDTYRVDPNGSETQFITDNSGIFFLEGLNVGTYYLTEIQAPSGYNKLEKPLKIEITADGATGTSVTEGIVGRLSVDGGAQNANRVVNVTNKGGALMPSTGGIGTTVFYIVGGVLILAAVVYFVVRRRKKSNGAATN